MPWAVQYHFVTVLVCVDDRSANIAIVAMSEHNNLNQDRALDIFNLYKYKIKNNFRCQTSRVWRSVHLFPKHSCQKYWLSISDMQFNVTILWTWLFLYLPTNFSLFIPVFTISSTVLNEIWLGAYSNFTLVYLPILKMFIVYDFR